MHAGIEKGRLFQRTSAALGEILINKSFPSSSTLGFCSTLVAGRMLVVEKEERCPKASKRNTDRDDDELARGQRNLGRSVDRWETVSQKDAEKLNVGNVAGESAETAVRGEWEREIRRAAVERIGRDMFVVIEGRVGVRKGD